MSRDLLATVDALGMKDAPLSLVEERDYVRGFVLFSDAAAEDAFIFAAAEALAVGEGGGVPAHSALELVTADAIEPECLAEIAAHGWEIAAPDAHPDAVVVDDSGTRRHPTPHDLAQLEAVSGARRAEPVERVARGPARWRSDRGCL